MVGDISGDKELLSKATEILNIDGLPLLVSRRKAEVVKRTRLEVDEILGLMEMSDEKQQLSLLPSLLHWTQNTAQKPAGGHH